MTQSKLQSAIEACANIVVGMGVALLSQVILFPIFDIHVTSKTHLCITLWFTVISLVRSYFLRRYFNARLHKASEKLARKLQNG